METINNDKLEKIKGGALITVWGGLAISAIVIFVSGIIEGLTNPKRCNE